MPATPWRLARHCPRRVRNHAAASEEALDRRIARLCPKSVASSGSSSECSWRLGPLTTRHTFTRTTASTWLCSASMPWISSRATCPVHNDDLSRRGRSFTEQSSRLIGSGCRQVARRCRLLRYNRDMDSHPLHRVTAFERVGPYVLRVAFDDGAQQTIDFAPVLAGELYGPLQDPALFGEVRLDPEVHTLVWPNGADFDPATLHDWPLVIDELRARARHWSWAPTLP
jgi:hypothetical protein